MPATLSIGFQGAARTVTGSRHRMRFGDRTWLFDCGLYQGHREEADRINRSFAFEPAELDSVVLSHAHLDHSGNLPTLTSQGYTGKIHVTPSERPSVLYKQKIAMSPSEPVGRPSRSLNQACAASSTSARW